MAAYVYILKSDAGTFYVGSTNNLERRIGQHLSGHTQTTKNRKIDTLVFSQEFPTLIKARRMERRIKSWKRKDYIEKIVNEGYIRHVDGKPL